MRKLYADIDSAYSAIASAYEFDCRGCSDNCCNQRFHHHTLAEYFYLTEGLSRVNDELAERILRRARVAVGTYMAELQAGEILPVMCPANEEGLCTLYEWRPMICRLHGLPHRFTKPSGETVEAGGCGMFFKQAKNPNLLYAPRLDRTDFYRRLADIEIEIRRELNYRKRYSKTTAEMLLDIETAALSNPFGDY